MPGNLANCLSHWKCLTSDNVILSYVSGYKIEFLEIPVQEHLPRQYNLDAHQKSILQSQIHDMVDNGVLKQVALENDMFISNVFGRPKPNGDIRMIIDLSEVNECVQKFHFKMDHLNVALDLVDQDMYMTSIDLKDAYYSVPIWECHRKYLSFQWEGSYFQFQVLPFGLTSAPRVFTKILKPVFSKMREDGFSVLGYIDDSLILAESYDKCLEATNKLAQLLTQLGFTINYKKSNFTPSKSVVFLGYVINSEKMTVSPTVKKKDKTFELINSLRSRTSHKIRFVASAIGFIVDLCKGVEYGQNHYRFLERDKIEALKIAGRKGYNGMMKLSPQALIELSWWESNVLSRSKKIRVGKPNLTIVTDASELGWGAVSDGERTGGRWLDDEIDRHINVLELHAILLGLKSFFSQRTDVEILVKTDNTTAISYINRMGGSRSIQCESIAKLIWEFCEQRELWLVATHIPGILNDEADFMSRHFTDNTEWSLNPCIFSKICAEWGQPDIDLFASRFNHKTPVYVSWMRDPEAVHVNAFTVDWDDWELIYVFPPFSLVTKCLRWIRRTSASVILIVPNWPGQVWFSQLREPMVKKRLLFPRRKGNLIPQGKELQSSLISEVPILALLC